jgi:hypothetical protein
MSTSSPSLYFWNTAPFYVLHQTVVVKFFLNYFLLKIYRIVESLQSHFILTMSHWSSRLPVLFTSQRTWVQIPRGVIMWNRDSPVSVVLLHWWPRRDWSLWPPMRRASSRTVTRPSCWQCDNPTWSHTAFLSQFNTHCRSSFQHHNHTVGCWGGALWRTCNLTSFSPCLTGPVDYLFASCHKGPGVQIPRGVLVLDRDSPLSVV